MDNATAFGLALVDIVFMLFTAISVLDVATHNHLNNWYENIGFRGGMSIYAGWLTTATILNLCFFLKSIGFDLNDINMPINEILLSKIFLTVAFLFYNSYSAIERNPLFGAVFIYVLIAIKSKASGKVDTGDLVDFIDLLLPVHMITDTLIGAYSFYEYRAGTIDHGLFLWGDVSK